jgi:hypothetical protein
MKRWLLLLLMVCVSRGALAHKASDSYLTLRADASAEKLVGHWDIAMRDLALIVPLDANDDRTVTWGELQPQLASIANATQKALHIRTNNEACTARLQFDTLVEHSDGLYVRQTLDTDCTLTPTTTLALQYRLLHDIDAQHRGLVRTALFGADRQWVATPGEMPLTLHGSTTSGGLSALGTYFVDGVKHIAAGLDHVLFVGLLVLGALRRTQHAAPNERSVTRELLFVISAFSVAHCITLSLTALGLVNVSSRIVEPLIALSVLLTAVDVLRPLLTSHRALIVGAFGLLHGFGFAGGLTPLAGTPSEIALSLLAFLLGIEAGQLLIAGAALLLLTPWLRRGGLSPRAIRFACVPVIVLAAVWVVERVAATSS